MATERNIRVSDADRDAVAAQLREHYAQGRLTLDELNERLDRAFASRTNFELAAVTSDLPYAAARGVLPADRVRQGGHQRSRGDQRRDQHAGQGWAGPGWAGPGGHGEQWDRGRGYAASLLGVVMVACAFFCLLVLMAVMGFGFGSGPSVVVIILGALALLRRLFGFGRRKSMPTRRRGRRW
jgi:Flp pilus assembly protein TadB